MPTSLTLDEHLDAITTSGERLVALAAEAGPDAAVPTCPGWTVRELLAHQCMVHRWATAHVQGGDPTSVPDESAIAAGRVDVVDLVSYFREGHGELVAALRDAPADLEAMRFLNDAPAPREFWARRQAHETTIHMVDALAASLGRVPTVDEVGVGAALAADGIDEILRGIFTRGPSELYAGTEYTLAVAPTDVDRRWSVRVGTPRLTVDALETPDAADAAEARLTGTAAALYLALWNRGDDVVAAGHPDLLVRWRATHRVTWT